MDKQQKLAETRKLQEQLHTLLKEVGWDIKKLAEEIAIADETADLRDDIDPNKEYEKIRKLLQRKTTKPETLNHYINFIIEQNKSKQIYKVPELKDDYFQEKLSGGIDWIKIFNGIEQVAQQHFSSISQEKK